MGDILTINGVNFCNNTVNVNSVTQVNTLTIDSVPTNCEDPGCYPCGPLQFAYSGPLAVASCTEACVGDCVFYYTKDYGLAGGGVSTGCTECGLVQGVPLYDDTICTPVKDGYYSPNNCSVDCDRCYLVMGGIIVGISVCEPICEPCDNGVMLTYSAEDCPVACSKDTCVKYYSDGNCDLCPLIVGDYLYSENITCTPVPAGYYSTNNCASTPSSCDVCYHVDAAGQITTVTNCDPIVSECREVLMTIIGQETCGNACKDESCVTRWTNRPTGQLVQAGDYIYDNSDCTCPDDSWASSEGFWQVWGAGCNQSPIPPYYNQCVYIPIDSCQITQVASCADGPVDVTKWFGGEVGTNRDDDLGVTLTVYLIEVEETTYTIDLTLGDEVVMEAPIMEEPVTNYSHPFGLVELEPNTYQIRITSANPEQPIYTQSFDWPVADG